VGLYNYAFVGVTRVVTATVSCNSKVHVTMRQDDFKCLTVTRLG